MMNQPVTQAQMDDFAERLARVERVQEDAASTARMTTIVLGTAIAVTAMGIRSARRSVNNGGGGEGWIKVPAGHSVVALPPGQSHNHGNR